VESSVLQKHRTFRRSRPSHLLGSRGRGGHRSHALSVRDSSPVAVFRCRGDTDRASILRTPSTDIGTGRHGVGAPATPHAATGDGGHDPTYESLQGGIGMPLHLASRGSIVVVSRYRRRLRLLSGRDGGGELSRRIIGVVPTRPFRFRRRELRGIGTVENSHPDDKSERVL